MKYIKLYEELINQYEKLIDTIKKNKYYTRHIIYELADNTAADLEIEDYESVQYYKSNIEYGEEDIKTVDNLENNKLYILTIFYKFPYNKDKDEENCYINICISIINNVLYYNIFIDRQEGMHALNNNNLIKLDFNTFHKDIFNKYIDKIIDRINKNINDINGFLYSICFNKFFKLNNSKLNNNLYKILIKSIKNDQLFGIYCTYLKKYLYSDKFLNILNKKASLYEIVINAIQHDIKDYSNKEYTIFLKDLLNKVLALTGQNSGLDLI